MNELAEGHRSRLKQRLMKMSLGSIANYELLELILILAIPRRDVKPLAKNLLLEFKTLGNVIYAEPEVLSQISGVGPAVISTFRIFKETIAHITKEQVIDLVELDTTDRLVNYLRSAIGYSPTEQFHILFLNNKLALIADELQDYGTINSISIYPREVIKKVLYHSANNIVLVHNHPSGSTKPSRADLELTEVTIRALNSIDVKLVDHIIISPTSYYSFKAHKIL